MKIKLNYLFIIILTFSLSCKKNKALVPIQTEDCSTITFSNQIKSLFQERCIICHGSGSSNGAMTNYAEINQFIDNDVLNSRVIEIKDMPSGSQLTDVQLHQIQCWLEAGSPNN